MPDALATLVDRHLRWALWSLLVFAAMGATLEALHAFKIGFYLDIASAPRRHLWTLAHAHGTLLALVHAAFAGVLALRGARLVRGRPLASAALRGAGVLVPAGFFLGGLRPEGGDPGTGILLVPVGAALLIGAVGWTAVGLTRRAPGGDDAADASPVAAGGLPR